MYFYEKLLRDTLENTELSQREIARATGIPPTTLNEWLLSGVKPHVKNLIRLSEWSGYPVPALLVDTENNLAERIILLMHYLSDDQKQQIVNQMERMIPDDAAVP